ncbi:hypothetical protein C8R45DRAFT_766091, partial [Mycena sanguinolenta]
MHLIPENVVSNLITLWTGDFKGIEDGKEDYKLQPAVINAIGNACVVAGNTTPAAFGARVPNLATERHYYTAESYTIFTTLLGPVFLWNRFSKPKYYKHFLELVSIFNDCLKMSIDRDYVDTVLRGRIVEWVELYEKYYYRYEVSRLPVCVLTLHTLLPIPDDILNASPMWCYWNYVTERYVGFITRSSKSHKNPYASFAQRIRDIAQNTAIKVKYNLHQELDLSDRHDELQRGRCFADYPDISVLKPHLVGPVVPQVRKAVKNFILRSFDVSADEAARFVPEQVSQWGKIVFLNGGDTIRAGDLVQQSEHNMTRDASFLKYSHEIDKNENHSRMPIAWERQSVYGQLLRIIDFSVNIPGSAPRHLLLAVICPVHVFSSKSNPNTPYYQEAKFKPLEVVDVDDLSYLVARVPDHAPGPRRWELCER